MQRAYGLALVGGLVAVIVFTGNRISTVTCFKISANSRKIYDFTREALRANNYVTFAPLANPANTLDLQLQKNTQVYVCVCVFMCVPCVFMCVFVW